MGDTTGITWTDHTFNPVIGCTKVSPGCDHCYAETLATTRMQRVWGPGAERRRTAVANWNKPKQWNRAAIKEGRRHRVFCASMADVFDAEWPAGVRDDLWQLIRETPMLDWQLLTKRTRAKWILKCLPADWDNGYPNVWLGSSVENQETAERRIPELLAVPAALHWLSIEPLIGGINLLRCFAIADDDWQRVNDLEDRNYDGEPEEFIEECEAECDWINFGNDLVVNPAWREHKAWRNMRARMFALERSIDWVVVGGESGKGARPMQKLWVDSLKWQCAPEVPFFFKQIGDAADWKIPGAHHGGDLLDGKQWHQFPEVHYAARSA